MHKLLRSDRNSNRDPTVTADNPGKTMRALLLRRHGSRDDLELVDDYPAPRAVEELTEILLHPRFSKRHWP